MGPIISLKIKEARGAILEFGWLLADFYGAHNFIENEEGRGAILEFEWLLADFYGASLKMEEARGAILEFDSSVFLWGPSFH